MEQNIGKIKAVYSGLWMLNLNLKGYIADKYSIEGMLGIGLDGPSYKEGNNYLGIGLKGMYEFTRVSTLNLYGYVLSWFLKGSPAAIGDSDFGRNAKYVMGLGGGIGS
ncbi:MAG: hypothetical protein Q8M94_04290, partial [Ignavibacteria bacterium]|nr:hypothetical protein [Ignavibacteria bacterium]